VTDERGPTVAGERALLHHGPVSLRFVLAHLVAELARHAGHGGILVEQLRARRG
jgi:hypothetical protein